MHNYRKYIIVTESENDDDDDDDVWNAMQRQKHTHTYIRALLYALNHELNECIV